MAMQMVMEGTTTRSSLQIADELALVAVNMGSYSDLDVGEVWMTALKDKLDAGLSVFADVILHPAFPESDLQRLKQIALAGIQQEMVQPFSMGLRVLPYLLYGPDHAYGQPSPAAGLRRRFAR